MSEIISNAKKLIITLQSDNKRLRKQTLIDLEKLLKTSNLTNEELLQLFNEIYIHTLNTLRDKSDAVREQGVIFARYLIIELLPINDYYLSYVFPVLVERLGSVELVETCEEIRLVLLQFLQDIISKYSENNRLRPFLNNSIIILRECLADNFPAIKELTSKCIVELSFALPQDFHMQADCLVKPLIKCYGHQRYRVRLEAARAMGEVVMHASHKGVDEAMVPTAQLMFDQMAVIRQTVSQISAKWLREHRDRYSYFHKFLPLILTGLNDEDDGVRGLTGTLWRSVGLQYMQENEKDLKDQMDFLENPALDRPNLGCRVLIQNNVSKILGAVLSELDSWQDCVRAAAARLLYTLILHSESNFMFHLQMALPVMVRNARDQDKPISDQIIASARLIGGFIPAENWMKIVRPMISENCTWGTLYVLYGLIDASTQESIQMHLDEISKILAEDSICYSVKVEYQEKLLLCADAIGRKIDGLNCVELGYCLFKIIIACVAHRPKTSNSDYMEYLDNLFKYLNLADLYQLWSQYLGQLLGDINQSPASWTGVTAQRLVFEIILLESGEAFGEQLPAIGDILRLTLDPDGDPEARLKTFWALTVAFESKSVIFKRSAPDIKSKFISGLIEDVFVPNLVWHAGATAEAVRTMVLACLKNALPTKSDTINLQRPLFDRLQNLLLSLCEDASHKSRVFSLECLLILKNWMHELNMWSCDDLIKVYPVVLQRLDDPTNDVRMTALKVLPNILGDVPIEFKDKVFISHHQLLIDTLLLHFDDDDDDVQNGAYECIKMVACINSKELQNKIDKHKCLARNLEGFQTIQEMLDKIDLN